MSGNQIVQRADGNAFTLKLAANHAIGGGCIVVKWKYVQDTTELYQQLDVLGRIGAFVHAALEFCKRDCRDRDVTRLNLLNVAENPTGRSSYHIDADIGVQHVHHSVRGGSPRHREQRAHTRRRGACPLGSVVIEFCQVSPSKGPGNCRSARADNFTLV
jgi:hypothetical protein